MIYFSTQQTGDTLEISSEKSVRWWDFFLGNARLSDLEDTVPQGYQGALSIDTQSGTIKVEGVKADALALAIDSGAGDIEFSGTVQSLQLTSTCGDIEVKGGIVLEQMSLQTSSGDIALGPRRDRAADSPIDQRGYGDCAAMSAASEDCYHLWRYCIFRYGYASTSK